MGRVEWMHPIGLYGSSQSVHGTPESERAQDRSERRPERDGRGRVETRFLAGRQKFAGSGSGGSAPCGSVVVVFRAALKEREGTNG